MYCYISALLSLSEKVIPCNLLRLLPSLPPPFFRASLKDLFTFSSPPPLLTPPQPSFISISLPGLLGMPCWVPPSSEQHSVYVQSASSDTDRLVSIPARTTTLHKGLEFLLYRTDTSIYHAPNPASNFKIFKLLHRSTNSTAHYVETTFYGYPAGYEIFCCYRTRKFIAVTIKATRYVLTSTTLI
jgi:hypothetical protein